MPILIFLLLILALVLFWQAARRQRSSGLPGGRIIYTDTRSWGKVEKSLYDADTGLTGKPDYLIEQRGRLVPVEVKTSRIPEAPYDSHIFQLAAYCLLVQRTYEKRPSYGIIHYSDGGKNSRSFAVDYTAGLERALLDLIAEMQSIPPSQEVARSHDNAARCSHCGYRSVCDQKL